MTVKKIAALKSYLCPECLTPLKPDIELGAYLCQNTDCNGEYWPDPMGKAADQKQITHEFSGQYVSRGQVNNKVKGGSSNGKKYGGKERMKKPTTHQLYEKLCNRN